MIARRSVFLAALVFSGAVFSGAAFAGSIVVPAGNAGTEGDSNNSFPFNITSFDVASMRYQQVYGASAFSGPIMITGIDFRPDLDTGQAFSGTIPLIQIDLSTTSQAVDGLSSTFASNVGADDTVVYALGALSLSSAFTGAGPKDFDIHIQFTTPFLYNPVNGNLLLDIRNFGNQAVFAPFDSTSISNDTTSRVWRTDVAAATGLADSDGLVTRFDFGASTPEPATVSLVTLSLAGLAALRRRKL